MTNKQYPRTWHESEAIRLATEAVRKTGGYGGKGLIEANRLIAHARTHLGSIGLRTSKRTDRLWAFVCKADKLVQKRTEAMIAAFDA